MDITYRQDKQSNSNNIMNMAIILLPRGIVKVGDFAEELGMAGKELLKAMCDLPRHNLWQS
jgi:hypothetical protein